MSQNGPQKKRPRYRLKLFERKLTVPVTGEMARRLEAESGMEKLSVAELIRRCVDIGIPRLRDRRRKRKRKPAAVVGAKT